MAIRSSWKGFLKLSLVSLPVKAYTASASGQTEIHLNQLHSECKSRIRYQKTCPIHGEVPADQIVSGYEYAKGQFVVVDPEELDALRTESDKAITIDTFIPSEELDPIYFSGRNYYLLPDGPVGQKPYAVLHRAMTEEDCCAIAQVVLSGREQLVLVRPLEKLLVMTLLEFEPQVKKPGVFEDELTSVQIAEEELQLTKSLMETFRKKGFDFAGYKDDYTEKLTQLIEAKVEGRELVAAPQAQEPAVISLMDALRKSVEEAAAAPPVPRKMAASGARERPAAKRQKKSG